MIDMILAAIRETGASAYQIRRSETQEAELYFIKKELDMRRMKHITGYEVTVYHDHEADGTKMRGFASALILPEMDEDRVRKEIQEAYYAASFVNNPYFELPKGKKEEPVPPKGKLAELSLEETANAFVNALYEADCRTDAFINSAEFFVKKEQTAVYNSEGIEVSYGMCRVTGEFITQCKEPLDVELYNDFSFTDLDTDTLNTQVREALDTVCARAKATTAPAGGTYDVLLTGQEVGRLFELYRSRANTAVIYPGYSNYKVGTQVQGDHVEGEKLNVTLTAKEPYSYEGISMKDLSLIEDGELKAIFGNARFSYYMGVPATGSYNAFRVDNGTLTEEAMKEKPYLHVVSFSDFQVDSMSGYIGGEIRLAYLYDGKTVTPVTGGSISGNLLELQKNLTFSKERYKDSRYEGPHMICLKGMAVAGA